MKSLDSSNNTGSLRRLRVFLCHSSNDKPQVRDLYRRLKADGIEPWLDEEDILGGQDWRNEIPRAVRDSDIVLVCLSRGSITKVGYVQREIKYALDIADEQPEDTIYLIPLKLEECEIPDRLRGLQWVNFFDENGYEKLMRSLRRRAEAIGAEVPSIAESDSKHSHGVAKQDEAKDALARKDPALTTDKPHMTEEMDSEAESSLTKTIPSELVQSVPTTKHLLPSWVSINLVGGGFIGLMTIMLLISALISNKNLAPAVTPTTIPEASTGTPAIARALTSTSIPTLRLESTPTSTRQTVTSIVTSTRPPTAIPITT